MVRRIDYLSTNYKTESYRGGTFQEFIGRLKRPWLGSISAEDIHQGNAIHLICGTSLCSTSKFLLLKSGVGYAERLKGNTTPTSKKASPSFPSLPLRSDHPERGFSQ